MKLKEQVLMLILISSIISGCNKKEDLTISQLIQNNSENSLLDEKIENDSDKNLISNLSKTENNIDKYLEKDYYTLDKLDISKEINEYGISDIKKLCNYVLVSNICELYNLDINDEHFYSIDYVSDLNDTDDKAGYILYFDDKIIYVDRDYRRNLYFDLLRYIVIFDDFNLSIDNNTVKVLKDALSICKNIEESNSYINNDKLFTKDNTKILFK